MTYIEFLDSTAAENICASLVAPPERVFLIGNNRNTLEEHATRYHQLFLDREQDVEFIPRQADKNRIQDIIALLSELVEAYPDCSIDLTGGEDLYLVAVGIIAERYKDKPFRMHRINIRNGEILDCDQDGNTLEGLARMSIRENILVYGGAVVYDRRKANCTYSWDMSQEFRSDIAAMWSVCKLDPRAWNRQIGALADLCARDPETEEPLTVRLPFSSFESCVLQRNAEMESMQEMLRKLHRDGVIDFRCSGEESVSITFQNEQVKNA